MRQEISGKAVLIQDLSTQAESLTDSVEELNRNITDHDKQLQQTKEEAEIKLRYVSTMFNVKQELLTLI